MTKAVSLLVARETQTWIEALYESGAVSFAADGKVTVDQNVRDLVSQMHDALAAGDAGRKAELERLFDAAVDTTSDLGSKMGPGTLTV